MAGEDFKLNGVNISKFTSVKGNESKNLKVKNDGLQQKLLAALNGSDRTNDTDAIISFVPKKQVEAREKLDKKVSSTGITYKQARETVAKIKEKYANDKRYQSNFESEQPKDGRMIYIMPHKAFDPYKLPDPDRSNYFEAIAAMQEIENSNSALVAQAGLEATESPSKNYSKGPSLNDILY